MKACVYCLNEDLFVFADHKEYRYLRVSHAEKSLNNHFVKDVDQIFNLFHGVYDWFFSGCIKENAAWLSNTNFRYLNALKSNYHTLVAIEKALKNIIEKHEGENALISLLSDIYHEEKGHYRLIEKDVGCSIDILKNEGYSMSSALVNHIDTISGPNSALDILAVGLVLECNSLHVDHGRLSDVLNDVDGQSDFYTIHSYSDTELEHFKRNIAFLATLKPSQLERIFEQVGVVISLFFSFQQTQH